MSSRTKNAFSTSSSQPPPVPDDSASNNDGTAEPSLNFDARVPQPSQISAQAESGTPQLSDDERALAATHAANTRNADLSDAVTNNNISLVTQAALTLSISTRTVASLETTPFNLDLRNFTHDTGSLQIAMGFNIIEEPPRIFEYVAVTSDSIQPNPASYTLSSHAVNIPQIRQTAELFNERTLCVHYKLRDSINGHTITDPMAMSVSLLNVQDIVGPDVSQRAIVGAMESGSSVTVYNVRSNFTPLLTDMQTRLTSFLDLFIAFDNSLYAIPTKMNVADETSSFPVQTSLSREVFWDKAAPHFYLTVFSFAQNWLRDAIQDMAGRFPVKFRELDPATYNGKKYYSTVALATDQYAADAANVTFSRFRDNQLPSEMFRRLVEANMFERDTAITSSQDAEMMRLAYSPTTQERDLVMYMMFASKAVRQQIVSAAFFRTESIHRFTLLPIEDVWTSQAVSISGISAEFNSAFANMLAIGGSQSFDRLIVMESLPEYFTFTYAHTNTPASAFVSVQLLALMFWAILFPAITNASINSFGYRLLDVLTMAYPEQMSNWVSKNGYARKNGRATRMGHGPITDSAARDGVIWSFFDPTATADNSTFGVQLAALRNVITPPSHPYVLDRKRYAQLPYMRTDYVSYESWQPRTYDDLNSNHKGDLETRLSSAITVARGFAKLVAGGLDPSRNDTHYLSTFFTKLQTYVRTVPYVFSRSALDVQRWLRNSVYNVYSQYDPATWNVLPKEVVLHTASGNITGSGLPVHRVPVMNLEPNIAMRIYLSGESEVSRGLNLAEKGSSVAARSHQLRGSFDHVQGHLLVREFLDLVPKARAMGFAMQYLMWLMAPADPANPLQSVALVLNRYMRFAPWRDLGTHIFSRLGLDFTEVFEDLATDPPEWFDGRYVTRQVSLRDPNLGQPMAVPPPGTRFGAPFTLVDSYTDSLLKIFKPLALDPNGPTITSAKGLYIGRFLTPSLKPQLSAPTAGWTLVPRDHWELKMEAGTRSVQVVHLRVRRPGTQDWDAYTLPRSNNMPKLMLEMSTFTAIPRVYHSFVARAILEGSLALSVQDALSHPQYQTLTDEVSDYDQTPTLDALCGILSTPDGQIIKLTFLDTEYAVNFYPSLISAAGDFFVQWFAIPSYSDKKLVAAVLGGVTEPIVDKTRLPPGETLGYGLFQDGVNYSTVGNPKINLGVPNWNNAYYAINPDLKEYRPMLNYQFESNFGEA